MSNRMQVEFDAKSVNEGFARVAVAAFLTQLKQYRRQLQMPLSMDMKTGKDKYT